MTKTGQLVAALAFAAASHTADARPLELVQGPLIVLAASAPPPGTRRKVVPRDVIMTTRLGWANAARLGEGATLGVSGLTSTLKPGALLIGYGVKGLGDKLAQTYCTDAQPAKDLPREAPPDQRLDGKPARFAYGVRFCLLDQDGDARFDHAFVAGAKWDEDAMPVAIAPLPFAAVRDEPIAGSEVAILYSKGALMEGPVIEYRVRRFGYGPKLLAVTLGEPGQQTSSSAARSVRRPAYPYTIAFGGAEVTLLGKKGREVEVEVAKNFTRQPIVFAELTGPAAIYVPGF